MKRDNFCGSSGCFQAKENPYVIRFAVHEKGKPISLGDESRSCCGDPVVQEDPVG